MEEARRVLEKTLDTIRPPDERWLAQARDRQLTLTKTPGSLGRLEEIAERLCAIQSTLEPVASPRRIVVFAADHGVAAEGVSPYPAEVIAQMVANFLSGGAAINALARASDTEICLVDIGVGRDLPNPTQHGRGWRSISVAPCPRRQGEHGGRAGHERERDAGGDPDRDRGGTTCREGRDRDPRPGGDGHRKHRQRRDPRGLRAGSRHGSWHGIDAASLSRKIATHERHVCGGGGIQRNGDFRIRRNLWDRLNNPSPGFRRV